MECLITERRKGPKPKGQAIDDCCTRSGSQGRQEEQMGMIWSQWKDMHLELKSQMATLQSEVQRLGKPPPQDVEPKAHEKNAQTILELRTDTQMRELRMDIDNIVTRLVVSETKLACAGNSLMPSPRQLEMKATTKGDSVASHEDVDLKIHETISVMKEEITREVLAKVLMEPKEQTKQVPATPPAPPSPPAFQHVAPPILAEEQSPPLNCGESKETVHAELLTSSPADTLAGTMAKDSHPELKSTGNIGEVDSRQKAETSWHPPSQNVLTHLSQELEHHCTVEEILEKDATANIDDMFQPYYKFKESVWDLAVFTGFVEIGLLGSFFAALVCLFNIILQFAFCIVVYLNFTGNSFDTDAVDGLHYFRLHAAHDAKYSDSLSAYTLAQGLCNNQKSFNWKTNRYLMGTSQLNTLSVIDSYLSDEASWVEQAFNGKLMCSLALACWCLSGLQEMRSVFHFFSAVLAIPRGDITKTKRTSRELTWISMGPMRFAVCVSIAVLRIACCGFIMYCGCVWLSYTDDASSLLLNAVALNFVINVDELLFSAMAPLPSKRLIQIAKPIREKGWAHCKGIDMFSLSVMVTFPALTLMFSYFWTDGMIEDMRLARSTLCDGNLTFSYSSDAMGMPWFQNWHPKGSESILKNIDIATTKSVYQLTYNKPPYMMNPTRLGQSDPVQISQLPFASLVPFANRGCRDIIEFSRHPDWKYRSYLKEFFKSQHLEAASTNCASACAALANFSSFQTGQYVRFICSESCGCQRPDGQLPANSAYYGCSEHCHFTKHYIDRLHSMPCVDPPITNLSQSDFWPNWIDFMNQTLNLYGNIKGSLWADDMELTGCNFLANVSHSTGQALCDGTEPFVRMRPFAPICPTMCGCHQMKSRECNPLCSR